MSVEGTNKGPSPSASTSVGFICLPIELRNCIYREVLALSDQVLLFQDPGGPIESLVPEKPPQWLGLLYTNRQISTEAKTILYRTNGFALEDGTRRQGNLLQSFLDCIGSMNAGFLSHLRMDFPLTEWGDGPSGGIRIREDGLRTLRLLQEQCTNLRTLETLVYGSTSGLIIDDETDARLLRDALQEIDTHFRAIGCLERIVVRVCNGTPASPTRDLMTQLGWIVLQGNR